MAGLEDTIRSAVPGGNVGKPLMLALGALLASGALFKASGAGSQPASGGGAPGMLGGLGGLLDKLQKGGLADIQFLGRLRTQSTGPLEPAGIGAGPRNHQDSRAAVGASRGGDHQTTGAGLARGRGQAHPRGPAPDSR